MARRFSRVNRSPRRETVWIHLTPTLGGLAAGGASLVAVLTAVGLALRPFTIVRTRALWHVRSDQQAVSEPYSAALGMCVVSEQATAIGVTAVPTPIVDMDSDLWFFHDLIGGSFRFLDATGVQDPAGISHNSDSKAMRRVNNDQDVAIVTESMTAGGGVDTIVGLRMLLKLH